MKAASRTISAHKMLVLFVTILIKSVNTEPQLDLPPINQGTQQSHYGYAQISSQKSINAPGNQYDVYTSTQGANFPYATSRPIINNPGVYPVSSTPFSDRQGLRPDISNNGYPSLDYTNGERRDNFNGNRNFNPNINPNSSPNINPIFVETPTSSQRSYFNQNFNPNVSPNINPAFVESPGSGQRPFIGQSINSNVGANINPAFVESPVSGQRPFIDQNINPNIGPNINPAFVETPTSSQSPFLDQNINSQITPKINPAFVETPTSSQRPFIDQFRDDRIDINNDPNFRRNDPNFLRNDPNYVGVNPYNDPNSPTFNPNQANGVDPRLYNIEQDIQQINDFLRQADEQGSKECTNNVAAQWNFETNVNEVTQLAALEAQQHYTLFQRSVWETASHIPRFPIRDVATFRQLRLLSIIGPAALPPDQLDRYNRLINDMLAVYNSASICAYNEPFKCGLHLQPDLHFIMSHSQDWDELTHTWVEWRRVTGRRTRDLYEQLADLTNQAARLNNFTDATQYWTFPYESSNFREEIEEVWQQVKPLYELLHAFVRRRLRETYGPERISRSAPIPAHVLGDMWGQSWTGIIPFTLPYPGKTLFDVTPDMIQKGYSPLTLFQIAEEFFVSLNMSAMPPDFWALSIFEQPPNRPIHCQPSAWDFCNRHDFRIKMCAHIDMKDLITAHHEMAHIQYFMSYANLPKVFRDGANPGFHEAIGETIALSVGSPKHLQTLGLVHKSIDDTAHDINYLYSLGLDKLAFLPFALVMDRWRWDVFSGHIRKEQYNCHWWRLREQYAGIKPPVLRSELDFDPGAKYHIPANIPYIRYFVSTILQFQLHRSICLKTGQYIPGDPHHPLHKCDIYQHPEAGKILTGIMQHGASVPWYQVLAEVTGEAKLDGNAIREFFAPLEDWLRSENLRTGEYIGWSYDGDYCKYSIETAGLQVYGGFYNAASSNFDSVSFVTILLASTIMTVIVSLCHR